MTQTLKLRTDGKQERLHKVLATSGLGSRRKLEERILQGEVKLNGQPAELGSVVSPGDRVELDSKTFVIRSASGRLGQVLMYHKPEGELTARVDPEGRPTVFESLPFLKGARWVAVGRLDFNTTGLLLFTTDGDLANRLMHPSNELPREYVARAFVDDPDDLPAILEKLRAPIELEDGPAQFDEVELIGSSGHNVLFKISLREGRNREVRRMFAAIGLEVGRLKRTRYGPIELPMRLARGSYETLSPELALNLAKAAGHEVAGSQLIAEPEALARQRERESGKRSRREITPLRRSPGDAGGARSSDEFDRPGELVDRRPDAGRDRPQRRGDGRRPDGRRPAGARDSRSDARPEGRRGGPNRGPQERRAGPAGRPVGARPAHAGARPGPAGRAAAGGPGRPAGAGARSGGPRQRRAPAEFKGPMDYASGSHLHDDRPLTEADDNRGNRIDAGAELAGGTAYTPGLGQEREWKPNWQPPAERAIGNDIAGNRPPPGQAPGRPPGKRRPGPGRGPARGGPRNAGPRSEASGNGPKPGAGPGPGPKPGGAKRRKPRPRRDRPSGPPRADD
jgi:23S rRNA pseudouridine2605 synthase